MIAIEDTQNGKLELIMMTTQFRPHLMITLSINRHDETDATSFVLVLWIVQSLSLGRLPVHQLVLHRLGMIRRGARRCHSYRPADLDAVLLAQNFN